jgi:hypothetical protein
LSPGGSGEGFSNLLNLKSWLGGQVRHIILTLFFGYRNIGEDN